MSGEDETTRLWDRATRHPFLAAVRDGTLAPAGFDHWLAQDALFAADLLTFQSLLLARCPRAAQRVVAAGCLAIVDELSWFEQQAAERGVRLDVAAGPATLAYGELLDRLDAAPAEIALTGLWAIERVYLDAWTYAAGGEPGEYLPFVEHWTTPDFGDYVLRLAEHADPDHPVAQEVLRHEVAFWDEATRDEATRDEAMTDAAARGGDQPGARSTGETSP